MTDEACEDPNAVHRWCRFKEDVLKHNFYKNHFTLENDEMHGSFEDMFDIEL